MGDEALARIGTMLEEIGSRFDLVIEAVSGFGAGLEKLREEMVGQFAEVGNQIRFLSDQIAENRQGVAALRADLSAEMIRLGEMIGRTRVEFREQLAATEANLGEMQLRAAPQSESVAIVVEEPAESVEGGEPTAARTARRSAEAAVTRELVGTIRELRREVRASAEATAKKLGADIKQANKALSTLARKFERFDDRMTVQVRDQEQRLRKLEQRRSRG